MKKQDHSEKKNHRGLRIAGFALLVFAASFFIGRVAFHPATQRSHANATAQTTEPVEPVPTYFASAAAARPFPYLLPAVDFRGYPSVESAYAVATEIPGVLAQQPCYCHCDRMGHRSLLDCYASQHAAGCGVCLMEALFARQMTDKGQDPTAIRQEIIRGDWRDVRLSEPLPF